MSKGKFSLTDFHSFNSRDLLTKSCKVQDTNKARYTPYKSAFFRKEFTPKSKMDDIQNFSSNVRLTCNKGPSVGEFKIHSKEALGGARLPSFNIKKLFTGEVKKRSQERMSESQHVLPSDPQRTGTSQFGMKRYWQKYLNQEITYGDLTKQLNRNIIEGQRRERRNQSEIRTCKENREESRSKVERSAFYVNNFIKTRYRKRRLEAQHCSEGVKRQEVVVVISVKQKQPTKVIKAEQPILTQKLTPLKNKKSWQMIPWQKFNDLQDDEFSQLQL